MAGGSIVVAGPFLDAGDSTLAKKHEEDLESAIRLERIDLADLQGLPLPMQ